MRKKMLVVAALVALPVAAAAQARIGVYTNQCHVISLDGPEGRVAQYRAMQAERFAAVSPAAVAHLRAGGVKVNVEQLGKLDCFPAGVPEKLVLTEVGKREPVMVIQLTATPVAMSNAMGATFKGWVGSATVSEAKLATLGAGKGYDLHLVMSKGSEKYYWDEGTLAELGIKP